MNWNETYQCLKLRPYQTCDTPTLYQSTVPLDHVVCGSTVLATYGNGVLWIRAEADVVSDKPGLGIAPAFEEFDCVSSHCCSTVGALFDTSLSQGVLRPIRTSYAALHHIDVFYPHNRFQ